MNKEALIDNFFEGTLTDSEKSVFEDLLNTDDEFATEVAFQESVKKQLYVQKRVALKAELQSFENYRRKKITLNWKWMSVAAMLVTGIFAWVLLQKNQTTQDIYTAYYQPFPNVVAPTVRGETEVSDGAKAMQLYDNEQYAAALPLFAELYKKDSADYSYFYQGICLLEIGNTENAITLFKNANYEEVKPWQNATDWYLALAYLKVGDDKRANLLLQKVANANEFMAGQARELVGQL